MVALSLKIGVGNVVKTMQFEPSTVVYDACRIIRERVPEAQLGQPSDYGLFLSDEDPKKGIWLEAGKALDYYMLRNGDTLEYKKKQRPLKIRMLDGTVKTVMVDDSKIVSDMLMTICARIGITNYDEYSLVRDVGEEKKEEATGTLKRDKTLLRDDKKMEKLKQKLHTDDELNWLDHGRTLREQGVEESEMLLLRRKFFYSDQNVDSRDPVQLNLLYVQARDDILNGSHPVSFDKACEFAGYQCQIQFGDHNESKHKPGFLDLKEFLPKEYIKNKGEKRIFQAHKNCQNMTEIEAKVSYVKLARSLKTYGVSFFLVKEKMKGKNKLVPRLLGITKECVMRVDEKTKEVIQEWSLTNIKRWAASPKSFTLDFGDYQDGYYSVQTTEGEQIAQLIAGYIDIILKKKKSKDHFGLEGDEESTMLEDSVSPNKSTVLQQQFNKVGKVETGSVALPAIIRSGAGGPESFQMGSMPQAKQHITSGQMHRGHMPPLISAQQALTGTINSSMQAVQAVQASLVEFDALPPLGTDAASQAWRKNKMDESKHEIHSQVDAITAGTASMVNLTAGDPAETDYTAVGCAVTTISSNLTEMSKGVKLLAALMEDEGGRGQQLLGAAKSLACAVSEMLKTAQPASTEPRQNLLQAAGNVGQASGELLQQIGESDADQHNQDMLMQLAKAVANAAAALVLKAKKFCLVVDTYKTAQEACGPLEIDNALTMVRGLERDMQEAKASASEGKLKPLPGETLEKCSQDLGSSTKAVSSAIAQLLSEATQGNENYTGMAARDVAQALRSLASAARGVAANTEDPHARNAMLDCTADVMDKSASLIEETKRAIAKPGDPDSQQRLAQVAKAVSQALNRSVNCLPGQRDVDNAIRTVGEASKKLLSDKFPVSGKSFQKAQANLNEAAAGLNQSANELVQASRGTTQDLSKASGKFGQDFNHFLLAGVDMAGQSQTVCGSTRGWIVPHRSLALFLPFLANSNVSLSLDSAVTDSINQLISMCTQQAPGQKECDNALRELETVGGMLENPTEAVSDMGYFDCIDSVMENSKILGEAMAGIFHNAKNSNLPEFGDSVSSASKALCGLTEAATQGAYLVGVSDPNSHAGQKGLVDPSQFARAKQSIQMACQNLVDPACTQSQVLSAATIVAKHTSALCNACRLASSKTSNPVAKRQFVQSAKEVANSTANLVKSIKALDGAFNQENRLKCKEATGPLIEAVDNLTAFASNPEFASVPAQISPEGLAAMEPIVTAAKTMLESSTGLIQTARTLAVNPKDPPKWSVLAEHSRTVSDSIKKLITNMREKAPGQRECDDAIEALNNCIREVDKASLAAISQQLTPRDDISHEALHEQMAASVHEISNLIEPVAIAARSDASQLGHKVSQMVSYFEPLIMAAIGTASKILNSQQQMSVLDQTKTLAESALQMLYTAKEAGGNHKVRRHQPNTAAGHDGSFDHICPRSAVVTKSNTNPDELGGLANQLTTEFGDLASEARCAAMTAENDENIKHNTYYRCTYLYIVNALIFKRFVDITREKYCNNVNYVKNNAFFEPPSMRACSSTPPKQNQDFQAAFHPEVKRDVQARALRFGSECATGYLGLLEHVLVIIQKPSHDLKQQLAHFSKRVAGSVTELIQAAEAMKGTEWVDPEDPTVIAENELLGAAAAIEAAAKKLEQLKPRAKPKEADESLNFEEQILEAAKSIAAATSALVKAASAAQRELVAQGKVGAIPANAVDDGQWSQGLISAARMVAAATNNLCEAANSAVQGHASEEKLISSAKQVAASTAQLLVACKVKADQDSQTMKRLQVAGNAVKRASDNLVKAAQKAAFEAHDDQAVMVKSKMVGGIAQIIAAQEEMLRKERELEEARKRLAMIRQQQYKFLPSELREDGQDQ
uniref:Talin-1-like n=1 Tax=Sinocyclocheilus grahami TaxID=75366 RepID=A0A672PZA4_SINGR